MRALRHRVGQQSNGGKRGWCEFSVLVYCLGVLGNGNDVVGATGRDTGGKPNDALPADRRRRTVPLGVSTVCSTWSGIRWQCMRHGAMNGAIVGAVE